MIFHIRLVLRGRAEPVFDRNEPKLFIEPTRRGILLVCMQCKARRAPLHGVSEQGGADTISLVGWTDIEASDVAPLEGQVANDAVLGFCHPDFANRSDLLAKHATGLVEGEALPGVNKRVRLAPGCVPHLNYRFQVLVFHQADMQDCFLSL